MAKVSIEELQTQIRNELATAFNTVWTVATKYSVVSIEHCLASNLSPDLIYFMAGELRTHVGPNGVHLKAFIKAVRLTTARELKWDGDKKAYTSSYHKEEFAKLKSEEFKWLDKLKSDGLAFFKPKPEAPKNSKSEFNKICRAIGKTLREVEEIDPDNADMGALKEKLQTILHSAEKLKTDVVARYNEKQKEGLAPKEREGDESDQLKAELNEINALDLSGDSPTVKLLRQRKVEIEEQLQAA